MTEPIDMNSPRDRDPVEPALRARRLATCGTLIRGGEIIDRTMAANLHVNTDLAMLLWIYRGQAEGREMYMFEVAQAATAPSSTAHRKLSEMVKLGMLSRSRTKSDHRCVCVQLTSDTLEAIDRLLDKLHAIGMASGNSA